MPLLPVDGGASIDFIACASWDKQT